MKDVIKEKAMADPHIQFVLIASKLAYG
jgi:hypothetical protein